MPDEAAQVSLEDQSGYTAISPVPVSTVLGAEIRGIDLRNMDGIMFQEIRKAFLQYSVLVVRGQFLDAAELLNFSRHWGRVFTTPGLKTVEGHPDVVPVFNVGKAASVTENWHSDSMFLQNPPSITMLSAQTLPPLGGDTMFSNQYLAFETLSAGMRRLLPTIRATHNSSNLVALKVATDGDEKVRQLSHPIIRTHPDTGRKALYIAAGANVSLEDFDETESRMLLDYLIRHSAEPDNIYRHKWEPGDLVFFDNRCTMHYAIHDYGTHDRLLYRTTIEGDAPR